MNKAGFFEMVYEVAKLIPEGKVTTYGAIANYLGNKGSARMVGWAINAAHTMPGIPAHRVVNRVGLLTGKHYFDARYPMQERLEAEGVKVVDHQIQKFETVFWDPMKELEL